MAYRLEGKDIVIDGWEAGIGQSPYEGFTDMRNAEIIEETGEISVAFAPAAVTLPPVFNAVAYTAESTDDRLTVASVTGLYEGCAIYLNTNTATGLATSTVYYVRNISALTFQVSLGPASAIVDITVDGTGTMTTYQYGNQRSLTDNGAPVSYFHAPEIGGVLLLDSSNRAWLWQQGSDGLTAQNTLLFLGNTFGVGATSDNQTGIAYWKGYVVVINQPNIVNVLKWADFSVNPVSWNHSSIRGTQDMQPVPFSSTASYRYWQYQLESTDNKAVELLDSDRVSSTGSASTIVSNTLTIHQTGEYLLVAVATYNNVAISSVDFNGQAMSLVSDNNGTSPFNYGVAIYELASPNVGSGVVTATYGSAVTNRVMTSALFRNATRGGNGSGQQVSAVSLFTPVAINVESPAEALIVFLLTNSNITFSPTAPTINLEYGTISSFANGFLLMQPLFGRSDTLKANVPITVGENNFLYWVGGENYISSLNENVGYIFDPTDTATYTISWSALDLPKAEKAQSIEMASGTLMIGTDSKKVYPWDTISPSFDNPVTLPEPGITDFVGVNQLLYTFGGNKGRIYLTNTSSAELYREIPGGLTLADRPFYFFWDANVGNNELYFAFQAYENDAPDTALTTTSGVWAINSDTGALRMVQSTVTGASWVRMALPVADGFTQELLRPAGQGLLVGYSVGSAYYLDFSSSLPHVAYSTYVETEIIPVGTFFYKKTFEHVEFKLGLPLVSGEGIKIYQRSNLNTSYTLVEEFNEAGIISGAKDITWENVEWMQIKVEMKSTAATPSYVRLREVRIR